MMDAEQAREILTKAARSKKNGQPLALVTHQAQLTNPLCGDYVQIQLRILDGVVEQANYLAKACAICSASAHLLCEKINTLAQEWGLARSPLTQQTARRLADIFEASLLEEESAPWPKELVEFVSLGHLRVNPARRACAILPWVVLKVALRSERDGQ